MAVAAYSFSGQMYAQAMAVIIAVVWTAVVSLLSLLICRAVFGLRVKEQEEREGHEGAAELRRLAADEGDELFQRGTEGGDSDPQRAVAAS